MLIQTDDELLTLVDVAGLWTSPDGTWPTLKAALLSAAEISGSGRSPYALKGPNAELIKHEQMSRLWSRLNIRPATRPS